MPTLSERLNKFDDDYLDFDEVSEKLSQRADMHAFMLLEKLVPDSGDLIDSSAHDEFYLSVDCEKLNAVVTDEQLKDLARCGIRYSDEYDCLCMFA